MSSAPNVQVGTTVTVGDVEVTVRKHLGSGAYGAVFVAEETKTGACRALKVLRGRSGDTRALRTELNAYSSLEEKCKESMDPSGTRQLPCLIARHGFADGSALLLTELATGTSGTKAFLKGRPNLTDYNFADFLMMLVRPLIMMHEARVTHGDLKPDNVVVQFNPESGKCVALTLVDFGLSCDTAGMDTAQRDTCFNFYPRVPNYMDPEYKRGSANLFQSDLYALGRMFMYFIAKQQGVGALSDGMMYYLSGVARNLTYKNPMARLNARQTLAALQRAAYRPGSTLQVGGTTVVVDKRGYITRRFGRCVLAVTVSGTQQAAVLKLMLRKGKYKQQADRENLILANLEAHPQLPQLLAAEMDRERADLRLVVTAPGGRDGLDLGELLKKRGVPKKTEAREAIMLAMAEAVVRVHRNRSRTALGDMSLSNFRVLQERDPLQLAPVDFSHACSIDLQRDRPQLCSESSYNIFAGDVKKLAKVWEESFQLSKDPLIARMKKSPLVKRSTMEDVVRELRSRLGV